MFPLPLQEYICLLPVGPHLVNGLAIWEVSTILSMQTWTNVKMAGGMSLHAAWRHVEH